MSNFPSLTNPNVVDPFRLLIYLSNSKHIHINFVQIYSLINFHFSLLFLSILILNKIPLI
nr:MAG TPA: hypothetical protein [Caudoviricetes sp.]DAS38248.1 MAG TPA: hypothetical protein [Bacteriophage sp.]